MTKAAGNTPQSKSSSSASSSSATSALFGWAWFGVAVYVVGFLLFNAYEIRMGAINEFGPVIHEFDPYFNFRATEVRSHIRVIFCVLSGPSFFVFVKASLKLNTGLRPYFPFVDLGLLFVNKEVGLTYSFSPLPPPWILWLFQCFMFYI